MSIHTNQYKTAPCDDCGEQHFRHNLRAGLCYKCEPVQLSAFARQAEAKANLERMHRQEDEALNRRVTLILLPLAILLAWRLLAALGILN